METRAINTSVVSAEAVIDTQTRGTETGAQLGEMFSKLLSTLIRGSKQEGIFQAASPLDLAPIPVGEQPVRKECAKLPIDKVEPQETEGEKAQEAADVQTQSAEEENTDNEQPVQTQMEAETEVQPVAEPVVVAEGEEEALPVETTPMAPQRPATPAETAQVKDSTMLKADTAIAEAKAPATEQDSQHAPKEQKTAMEQQPTAASPETQPTAQSTDSLSNEQLKTVVKEQGVKEKPAEQFGSQRMVGKQIPDEAPQAQQIAAVPEEALKQANSGQASTERNILGLGVGLALGHHIQHGGSEVGAQTGGVVSGNGVSANPLTQIFETEQKQGRTVSEEAKKLGKAISTEKRDEMVEKVKEVLRQAAEKKPGNTLVVRLDPPELGKLTVKVAHRDGQIFARIIPESSEVENMLRTRVTEMSQVLSSFGLHLDDVHVSIGAEHSETEMFQFSDFLQGRENGHNKEAYAEGREARAFESQLPGLPQKSVLAANELAGWVA